ncbi:MAG: 4a-hydroxytetrahydrobiopterin dehydratase [Thermoanaerobaculia bacterium]|nr:4a-hydroxytetrahydrobiopterin dehydratase [Thermoanaerobaculia bacterium]
MSRPTPLSSGEIAERLESLPGWSHADGALRREFVFPGFPEAFGFMTQVALAAEKMDHHPDWSNVWNRVCVSLRTHDAGGVTELDFRLADVMQRLMKNGE